MVDIPLWFCLAGTPLFLYFRFIVDLRFSKVQGSNKTKLNIY